MSELAKKLIAENKISKDTFLDLGKDYNFTTNNHLSI